MQANLKSRQCSYPVFLSFAFRVYPLNKTTQFLNVFFWNKFNSTTVFDHLHFLAWANVQCLPDCFWYNNLKFWRYGYSLHNKAPIDIVLCYGSIIDKDRQLLLDGQRCPSELQ